MVEVPEFLKDEILSYECTEENGAFWCHIRLKTMMPFESDSFGKVVSCDEDGVDATTLVAPNAADLDDKIRHLFFDLFHLHFWESKTQDPAQFNQKYPELFAWWEQRQNESISIELPARCTEWSRLTGDPKRPCEALVLYEVDDHPMWGKAEAWDTYVAYSEPGLADLIELARGWTVRKSTWEKVGSRSRPTWTSTIKPRDIYKRTVFVLVRRKDLPYRGRAAPDVPVVEQPAP